MAALQPSAEGQGSPTGKKTFSQLFSQPSTSPIQIRQATVYKGEAAVIFSRADVEKLAVPFRWALVGKFSHGRPSLEDIRKFFASLNLKDHISIGLMDYRHVLIKCSVEVDFNRIRTRGIWQLGNYPMRVFRWTREFHVQRESSLVPIWVELPNLPIHYFDKHSLFSILSPVGRPLFLDSATAAGTRPSVARVCVEIDVAKIVVPRILVAVEGESGFWQKIVPDNIPPYCSSCWRLGHSSSNCKNNVSKGELQYHNHQTNRLQQGPKILGDNQYGLVITPTGNPKAEGKSTMEVTTSTEDARPGAVAVQGASTSEMEKSVGPDRIAEKQNTTPPQDDKLNCITAQAQAAEASAADANGQSVVDDDREGPLHNVQTTIAGQDHAHNCEGSHNLVEQILGDVQQQMADTTTLINHNADNHSWNKGEGSQPVEEKHLGGEHLQQSDTTELETLYVDLCGVEEEDSKSDAVDEVALPTTAGNLSPRLVVTSERSVEPSINTLNIDQSVAMERDCRQEKVKGVRAYFPSDRQLRSATSSHNSFQERRVLWYTLLNDKPISLPWCIGGDFNVILAPHEKRGGRPFAIAEGMEFMSFMEDARVFDVGFSGASFTWSNNRRGRARVSKRLDRFLVNGACLDLSNAISVLHLARHPSDHAPLKISFKERSDHTPRPFRFLNVWTTKSELLEVIRYAWNQDVSGSPLRVLSSKLLATRRVIQTWNKQHFGNVFDAVRSAEMGVQRAEEAMDQYASEECQVELSKAQAELRHALSIEEQFWSQKARVKWLKHGDRNSRYFHAVVRQRRAQGMIHRIKKSNGVWVDKNDDIATEAITYFSDLFTCSLESSSDLRYLIPSIISEEDNEKLEEVPSIEEVYRVVRSMDGDSAAGPDGFTGKFFTFAWEVVAQDVYNAILSFFCGAELPRFITSTSIVLIPKMPNPQDFSQYRPISLCNFFNKLLSRILADRIAYVLPKIISPQQTGFVKGRNITDNFLLAQEIVSGIGKKNRGGNVVMKLDMSKAYDRVAWDHIIDVLRRFGFGEIFIDLVWRLISNVWFSVILNGASHGFFKSTRGLRQGDPLSPALFIIGAEVLSRGLNNLAMQSGFVGFKVPYACPSITHLAFADDVLIFANGSSYSLKVIMQVLEAYQRCSGQLINVLKTCYLVHPSLPPARRRVIERITKFTWQPFPIRYLGCPLYFGRCKSSYFGEACQSILGRIISLKSRMLSFGGKIVLIKHVLASMPVHLMSAAVIPSKVFRTIEKAFSTFIWSSSPEESKFHWIRWSHMCYPIDEGGVGFRKLQDIYTAFLFKLWWNFRKGLSLWAEFMKAKYCRHLHPCQVEIKAMDSALWRRMVNVSRQVEFSTLWIVKDGACHFWYDNWLGGGALFHQATVVPHLSFANFIINGHWDVNLLYQIMPREMVPSILEHPIPEEGGESEVIWTLTTSGNFSIASAFRDIRQARNKSMVFNTIWHSQLPFKDSFFMLRLLLGRLPVPDRLCKLGLHLPSKCFCCASASEESIEHLFSNGHIGSTVWHYFGASCGLSFPGSSLRPRIVGWWLSSYDSEIQRFIGHILPSIVCWQIWKARNKAMFEDVQMRPLAICRAIFSEIQTMVGIHFKQVFRVQSFHHLYDWSYSSHIEVTYKLVRWEAKESDRFILNTDGCSKGNPGVSGGGGVLRDSNGIPLIGFSAYLGETTSLCAEVRALLIGLQTCGS
ncbi:uncharacterized protein [Coffea arabica]|uniref:Reverse transcriptase domain-containing protein n=1 Tax=Coffea arabica TaxID=13443 RepID=A0ABM4WB78_COFAR